MKRINEQRAQEIALSVLQNHYRQKGLSTQDLPDLIKGISKISGLDAEIVRDFFSTCIIPVTMRASFGWKSTTTHCEGLPLSKVTQEKIALDALVYHVKKNGFKISPSMKQSLEERANETQTDYEELQSLFTEYLIPEAVKTALQINIWQMEISDSSRPSSKAERADF